MPRSLRTILALMLGALGVALVPAVASATTSADSYVTMVGDSGDSVTGGAKLLYRGTAVSVSGSVDGQVQVDVSGTASYTLDFAAPTGQSLTAGTYLHATRSGSASNPAIDIFGDGRGCNTTAGSFHVVDVAPDLSSLLMTYEEHCEGGAPAVFGEIRYNEPSTETDVVVAPDTVAWPETYPGASATPVPVTIANTGSTALTISGAALSGNDGSFSILSNGCTAPVAVGTSCKIYVRFVPTTAGDHTATLTTTDSSTAGTHSIALSGTGTSGYTWWRMRGDRGDWVVGNQTLSFTPLNSTITGSGSDTAFQFDVSNGSHNFSAEFKASSGNSLLPGTTFSNATRAAFSGSGAGLDVNGDGRGCNEITGSFTVDEATYDDSGAMLTARISFVQHCEGGAPAARGTISYKSSTPPPHVSRVTIKTDHASYRYGQTAHVTVGLTTASTNRTVDIYATTNGHRSLLDQVVIGAGTTVTRSKRVTEHTTFSMQYAGDDTNTPASASTAVKVSARVTAKVLTSLSRSGVYYVASYGTTVRILNTLSPNHAGACIYFRSQFKVNGRWGYTGVTGCDHLDANSRIVGTAPGSRNLIGVPVRLRMEWRGDARNTAAHGSWLYIRFVR